MEWPFLLATLSKFGYRNVFCKWIRVLYVQPTAAVIMNRTISQFFSITRSTRQGCSLSPLLFTIFLKPLATLIRAESRIKGVIGGNREHKLFLYAYDVLVLNQDPANSVSTLLETIEEYSKVPAIVSIGTSRKQCQLLERVDKVSYLRLILSGS